MRKPIPFSTLKLHPPYRAFRSGRDGVIGHDCESLLSGYAFLITDSFGNHSWIRSADDVVTWFSNPRYVNAFNTFWNMDFDVMVMLKWLGRTFCAQLMKDEYAVYGDVSFRYIPKRFLIVHKGKVWNAFYDAAQYYIPRSLDGASKVYLGKAKVKVGSKKFTMAHYDSEKILDYCIVDSKLCADLTRLLLMDLHDMGFSPTGLSSPGTIMEGALIGEVYFPDITKIPLGALEYAYNAYRGGWMECFKRGYFPKLWDYDISSAYPYQVSNLIGLDGGTWRYVEGEGFPEGAEYGFIYCLVDMSSDISPIIYQADVNTTPKGKWYTTLTLDEFNFVWYNRLGSVKPIRGWFFVPSAQEYKRLKAPMKRLFRLKQSVRNKWLPKAMSVSLYGKFAERSEDGRTGNLFNPIYASAITARTRLQIAKYALMAPEHVVLVATDGLTFDVPLPASVLSRGFGGMRLTHCDEGVVIGTNVCTIKGKFASGAWRPGRFNWLKLLREHPDDVIFELNHTRPVMLAEALKGNFEDAGVFMDFPYKFNLNFDHKRIYHKVSCARELMNGQFDCHPWDVSITMKRKALWELR